MSEGYDGLPAYYSQSSDPLTPNFGFSLKGMDPILAENFVLADAAIAAGGGSSVKINGVSVSNPNFNDTTPAAPTHAGLVSWQKDGSGNVSAYFGGSKTYPNLTISDGAFSSIAFSSTSQFGVFVNGFNFATISNDFNAGLQLGDSSGHGNFNLSGAGSAKIQTDTAGNTITVGATALTLPSPITIPGAVITDSTGSQWGAPTGGAKGAGTINALGLYVNGVAVATSGSGTVTSFSAGNLSPLFTTSVATATTTPALTFSLTNQNANIVYAGPSSGGAAAPTFRALVVGDLPIVSAAKGGTGIDTSASTGVPQVNAGTWSVSTALANGTTATTQTAGDNTTNVATTAFVTAAVAPANQSANKIYAGPTSGSPATPTFRSMVAADEPATTVNAVSNDTNIQGSISAQTLTFAWSGTLAASRGGTGSDSSAATGVAQVAAGVWSYSTALANGTTATTQTAGDSSTKVATTAFVNPTFPVSGAPFFIGGVGTFMPFGGGAAAVVTSATLATLHLFYIPVAITINHLTVNVAAVSGASQLTVGLYSCTGTQSGTLLMSATTNTSAGQATGNRTTALGAPVAITPGWYWYAIASNNSSTTFFGITFNAGAESMSSAVSVKRTATYTPTTAGTLNGSFAALTAASNTASMPICIFEN